ncbi:astacin, partial [Teladorsagia circumcincta]
ADRIVVKREKGCWAVLGRKGGEQTLSLGENCDTVGVAAHEIGHALGVHHTMTRHDRDKFIKVNVANVEPDKWSANLVKNTGETFHLPYDYGSIMHYGGTRFP